MDAKTAPLHLNRKALHYKARQKQLATEACPKNSVQFSGLWKFILYPMLATWLLVIIRGTGINIQISWIYLVTHTLKYLGICCNLSNCPICKVCRILFVQFHKFFINVFAISNLQVPVSQQKLK